MSEFYDEAVKKLDAGLGAKLDRYGEAMKQAVHDALKEFCRQDGEFAQAVAQGGSFADCMAAVAKGVKGSAISDLEAYRLAAQFYFPGSDIRMVMEIDLLASVRDDRKTQKSVVVDLSEFF